MQIRNKITGEIEDAGAIGQAGLGAYLAGGEWEIINGSLSDLTNEASILGGGTQGLVDRFMQSQQRPLTSTTTAQELPPYNPNDPFAGYNWTPPGGGMLTLRGPGGATQAIDAGNYQQINQMTRSGWTPLNEQGAQYQVREHQGGQLFYNPSTKQWVPLNVLLGGEWLPQQQAEMPNFYRTLGSNYDPQTGIPNTYGTTDTLDPNGNVQGPPAIPGIDLGQMPTMSAGLDPTEYQRSIDFMHGLANTIGQQYDKPLPEAQAALMPEGQVPQPNAQLMSDAFLDPFLSGQGYSPDILAKMRSRAVDDISTTSLSEMSQARRALEQSGLGESPAGAAIRSDVARRSGQEQTAALRDIDIQDANVGVENQRIGIGQKTAIGLSNMEQANQMALANANRLFASLNQNLSNQQQANMANFGANVDNRANQRSAVSNFLGQQGGQIQGAALAKNAGSDEFNTGNRINWTLNQAQLDRQRAIENQRAQEARWHTAYTTSAGFAPNISGYGTPSSSFSPTGAVFSGVGQGVLNQALNNWGQQ